jgi:hypothetical protein
LSDGLKWARRLRLDLAFEIQKLESGIRMVTETTANGPIDITDEVLKANKDLFAHPEQMIAGFDVAARGD